MFKIRNITNANNINITKDIQEATKVWLTSIGMDAVRYITENRFSKTYKKVKGVKVAGNEPATDRYSLKYGLKTINNITGMLKKSIQSFVIGWNKLVVGSFGVFYSIYFELSKKLEKYRIFKPTEDFVVEKIQKSKNTWWSNIIKRGYHYGK